MTGMSSRTGDARRSALQMSSLCAPRWTSGPLQIGQTRMSSRRASMNAFQNELRQTRIDFSVDSKRDQVVPAEVSAFYRILLGHQHEVAVRDVHIRSLKRVVIRKRGRRQYQHQERTRAEK